VLRSGEPVHDAEAEATLSIGGSQVRLWLEVSADPLVLDGRRHVVLALNNITARKRAEAELSRSNRDLEQFAYVASHDLQEPLRMVAGFLQLLRDRHAGKLDGKAKEYIGFAVEGAGRMSQLISDLLEYSRVQTRTPQPAPTDMKTVFRQAVANCQASIRQAQAAVTCEDLPTVLGDQAQLVQLLQNLLGNAVKFRRPDAPPEVRVGARRQADHWLFWVQDNGIGIQEDQAERLFLIFQRLHAQEKYPGTGIGLAICKKIVERHGGRIWVEPMPGGGSKFLFTIPAR
jgi:light-regulated signal transduction histidine kinase (bacteriophytochrome)